MPKRVSGADAMAAQLEAMASELRAQRALIEKQNEIIARQQLAIDTLLARSGADNGDLALLRGMGQAVAPATRPCPCLFS